MRLFDVRDRQCEAEDAALALGALEPDAAAVELDQLFGDRQPQAMRPVKHRLPCIAGDFQPWIADVDADVLIVTPRHNLDMRAWHGVWEAAIEEVGENCDQTLPIAVNWRQRRLYVADQCGLVF